MQNDFINYDLMELKPLPIEGSVAGIVCSSRMVEHVGDGAVRGVLKESYRVLKPGGHIRLMTPGAWLGCQAYKRNGVAYWCWVGYYSRLGAWDCGSVDFVHRRASRRRVCLLRCVVISRCELLFGVTRACRRALQRPFRRKSI